MRGTQADTAFAAAFANPFEPLNVLCIKNMNEPIHVNTDSFEAAVIRSPLPVLVDFWAPWCGPCKMISPIVDEIAREGAGRFRIVKVNVDENPALAQRFGLRGIPALLFFAGGELRHQVTGLSPKKRLLEKLEELTAQVPAA